MKKENFVKATKLIDRHTRIESDLEKIDLIRNKAKKSQSKMAVLESCR